MVELRWLERVESLNIEGKVVKRRKDILQYRQTEPGHTIPGMSINVMGWSEWKDVPTVKESDDGMDKC